MKNILYILSLFILVGCAGSANHDVVSAYQSKDSSLTCSEIDKEIVRAQVVIDGVNEDKSGISGADIMDGLLYFPFNMIAKSQNYKNSLTAADKRIERLENLKRDKDCRDTSQEMAKTKTSLSQELKELTKMYKSGDLSKKEYESAKNKLLLGN